MKSLLVACLVAPLLAQAPLHIVGVERRGLPPYEEGARLYRLDGGEGSGLKLGDRLTVRRLGGSTLALLKVVELKADWCLGVLDGVSTEAPMKGDFVLKSELSPLPVLSAQRDPLTAWPTGPRPSSLEAPPREGLIWFLPGSSELSPAGLAKVTGWVQAWGRDGRWSVLVGTAKECPKALREARGRALAEALKALGIEAAPALAERGVEGANHPAWVQRRD
jgi:hypothetical protein